MFFCVWRNTSDNSNHIYNSALWVFFPSLIHFCDIKLNQH